jgi:hypothetical protein
VYKAGGEVIAPLVDFRVDAAINGKTQELTLWQDYVSRWLPLSRDINPAAATGVRIDPATGKLSFVPTVFTTRDGKPAAELKRKGNSLYTVLERTKTFGDMKEHWAKQEVELLASKLIIDGTAEGKFTPEASVTCAEFAVMLTRVLGLDAVAPVQAEFADAAVSDWYAEAVNTAAAAGLADGFETGGFRPMEGITREQAAVMAA